ncbi:hypothetical protein Scep_024045 [Stephania cephalantha]|uniref:Tubby C-terminal domain-containing protein n=1 Tax=Stephania cephalantha TaxID=152367 RepID=A0AAP0EVT0_9MAGN
MRRIVEGDPESDRDVVEVTMQSLAALTDDGKFIFSACKCRRTTCTDYIISLDAGDISRGSSTYIGKLSQPPHIGAMVTKNRSTRLVGLKQVAHRVPSGNYSVARISYELNVLGSRGPRRMQCVMDDIPAASIEPGGSAPTPSGFSISNLDLFPSIPFLRFKSTRIDKFPSGPLSGPKEGMLVLKNKSPRWHEQLQSLVS